MQVRPDDLPGPAVVAATIIGRFHLHIQPMQSQRHPRARPSAQPDPLSTSRIVDSPGRILVVTSGTRLLAALNNGQLLLENAVQWGRRMTI